MRDAIRKHGGAKTAGLPVARARKNENEGKAVGNRRGWLPELMTKAQSQSQSQSVLTLL